jgi:hypothetical protein
MDEKSYVYFKDGHTEEILSYRDDEFPDIARFETQSGAYVRAWSNNTYEYYRTYINHDWETIYKRLHNIDRVELK